MWRRQKKPGENPATWCVLRYFRETEKVRIVESRTGRVSNEKGGKQLLGECSRNGEQEEQCFEDRGMVSTKNVMENLDKTPADCENCKTLFFKSEILGENQTKSTSAAPPAPSSLKRTSWTSRLSSRSSSRDRQTQNGMLGRRIPELKFVSITAVWQLHLLELSWIIVATVAMDHIQSKFMAWRITRWVLFIQNQEQLGDMGSCTSWISHKLLKNGCKSRLIRIVISQSWRNWVFPTSTSSLNRTNWGESWSRTLCSIGWKIHETSPNDVRRRQAKQTWNSDDTMLQLQMK